MSSNENVRILAITLAVVFLNLGLFFILFYFAALVAGLVAGYLIQARGKAILSGFIGSIGAYLGLFIWQSESLIAYIMTTELVNEIPPDMVMSLVWVAMIMAAALVSILGAIGAFISNKFFVRPEVPMYQQSGVLE